MAEIVELLADVVGAGNVLSGDDVSPDYAHDEALTATPSVPLAVVRPGCTAEVSAVLRIADELHVPVTARGSGTGLSGAAISPEDGILLSFERMNAILEIDLDNHVAVVQPGVTLEELNRAAAEHGLVYPVYPGEVTASLGGNVATNAGGMRAIKYGVTRHHVLGLEAVLASGDVIRTGGKFVKTSTGYDLTQLIVGSEGTLALVTEATLKLQPRLAHATTVLAPFTTLEEVTAAVPRIVAHGIGPVILEYVDMITMAAITANVGLDLGIPEPVRAAALAYLVIVLENSHEDRLEQDVDSVGSVARRARRHRGLRAAAACRHPVDQRPGEGVLRGQGGRGGRHRGPRRCPAPRSPGTWKRSRRWHGNTAPSSPGAATWATATSTCRCSSPIRSGAPRCCAPCSGPAWTWAGRSRANTASARRRRSTSWSSRIP